MTTEIIDTTRTHDQGKKERGMIRLAASLVTIGSLSLPVLLYQDEYRQLQESDGWLDHTFEARSLAERAARDALTGQPRETLAADVRALGSQTEDNPNQVDLVARMMEAVEASELRRLASLAEAAIAEEGRLMPIRKARERVRSEGVQARATLMWVGGVVAAVIQAVQAWMWRRPAP